ncbi:hypothetical protein DPR00_13870 [Burkholderia pseudomallei]|nr:hypothetical protein BOC36_33640 [Burkholderia pseudomallei]RKN94490.1 hypothetical protein D8O31_21990 [Burkholderia mallei]ARL05792.1 hypothetical protein BOC44_30110 [Burkholderia pseudomallei]ARL20010.1 hypothetical protein BOC46_32765 [Burkholderia pseudomallei]ARL26978.1 hypothetical protein BOC47_33245 [Burkholderia pseudomallei]
MRTRGNPKQLKRRPASSAMPARVDSCSYRTPSPLMPTHERAFCWSAHSPRDAHGGDALENG